MDFENILEDSPKSKSSTTSQQFDDITDGIPTLNNKVEKSDITLKETLELCQNMSKEITNMQNNIKELESIFDISMLLLAGIMVIFALIVIVISNNKCALTSQCNEYVSPELDFVDI